MAQAVILTCYELSKQESFTPLRAVSQRQLSSPTDQQKEILVDRVYHLCEQADLRPDLTPAQRKAFLRRLIGDLPISEIQLFFLKSLAERLSQRVR